MTDEPKLHEWEVVCHTSDFNHATARMRVPGGWLYRDRVSSGTSEYFNMVFVPDSATR